MDQKGVDRVAFHYLITRFTHKEVAPPIIRDTTGEHTIPNRGCGGNTC